MRVAAWILVIIVAGACRGAPAFGTPAPSFTAWLDSYGQVFEPRVAPPDAADWRPAVAVDLPVPPGSQVASALYGTVRCVDPSRNCANRGLARPGAKVPIWLVTFAETPATPGCVPWAVIDPVDGTFVVGGGGRACD